MLSLLLTQSGAIRVLNSRQNSLCSPQGAPHFPFGLLLAVLLAVISPWLVPDLHLQELHEPQRSYSYVPLRRSYLTLHKSACFSWFYHWKHFKRITSTWAPAEVKVYGATFSRTGTKTWKHFGMLILHENHYRCSLFMLTMAYVLISPLSWMESAP